MNKRIVRDFYGTSFNLHRPSEAVAKYVGSVYKQHNPSVADGPKAFISYVEAFIKANPRLNVTIKRVIAEGDLVVTHCHLTLNPSDRGSALMDIFRVEDGKIIEHWDVSQPIPEKSANSNTMF